MHDVVRDVALLIASEGKDKFLVKAAKGLREWPLKLNNTSESYTKMSLMYNYISKLPDGHELHFPLVDTFLIQGNRLSIVPDGFFRGFREVKVLDMSGNKISTLPPSLTLLTKLRMLDLSYNYNLREISILGELKELEILKLQYTGIEMVPHEIGQLTKLRLLNVECCNDLCEVIPGVISRLTCLEELSIEFSGPYIVELSELKSLKALDVYVFNTDLLKGIHLEALTGFSIQIGTQVKPAIEGLLNSYVKRQLFIADLNITPFIKKLVQISDAIILYGIRFYSIVPGLYEESFDDLKSISLIRCYMVSCLVKTRDGDAMQTIGERKPLEKYFSQVEEILLDHMDGLKLLWDCPHKYISFRNLQRIRIGFCNSLKTLFPATVAQGLVNLAEIKIENCILLEVVISASDMNTTSGEIEQTDATETDVDIIFPRLTRIELEYLPELQSFYSGHSTIEYPSLKNLRVWGCRRMTRWGYGVQDMPKIKFHLQGTRCFINDIMADETREDCISFGEVFIEFEEDCIEFGNDE